MYIKTTSIYYHHHFPLHEKTEKLKKKKKLGHWVYSCRTMAMYSIKLMSVSNYCVSYTEQSSFLQEPIKFDGLPFSCFL